MRTERVHTMRRSLSAAAVAISIASSSCAPSTSSAPGDAAQLGTRLAAALAATAAAKQGPALFQPGTPPTPLPATDRDSIDALLQALYGGVSHAANAEPDWARLEPLFVTGAGLAPPTHGAEERARALSFEQFREAAMKGIAARRADGSPAGFFESEIGRETRAFGNLTQVTSAYEARFRAEDPEPFLRGVNFIQLVRSAGGWAIVSIAWDTEGPNNPIPQSLIRTPPSAADPAPTPSR